MLAATGRAGVAFTELSDSDKAQFRGALNEVLQSLAIQIIEDAEGASKFVTIAVTGAASGRAARTIGLAVANSPLVKTAIAGEDANWGRIVMAVGKTEEPVDRDRLAVRFGPHVAAIDGAPSPTYDEAKMSAYMKNAEIDITVEVGAGRASATGWTCDLTKRYIEINGDYRS